MANEVTPYRLAYSYQSFTGFNSPMAVTTGALRSSETTNYLPVGKIILFTSALYLKKFELCQERKTVTQ